MTSLTNYKYTLYGKVCFKTIYNWIYTGKINSNNLQLLRHKGRKRKGVEKKEYFQMGHQ